ncbi:SDR family oxidoreductase [Ectothiorhodospira haloalkaliphila]|nr:SDR family NAD(P)-dependent oxidoreductase [Ectothiorhodospira haloalkaliphila]
MPGRRKGWTVVTGAGSGMGRALAWDLASRGGRVIAIGRRADALEETRAKAPESIQVAVADVSTPAGRDAIALAAAAQGTIHALVHNAAVLEPVGALSEVSLDDWRYQQAVNVEGPLFLTQALLPYLAEDGRILHVSSGAAHRSLNGWGGYCASKAALYMLYQCLREELGSRSIHVGSVRPGVVDTPMQQQIRETDEQRFPGVERFRRLKTEGQLQPPERVADFMSWILLETGDKQFSLEEWDIDNESQTRLWKDTRQV